MRRILIASILFWTSFCLFVNAKTLLLRAKFQRVVDGDTYIVNYYDLPLRVRAKDIDTFETRKSKRLLYQEKKFHLTKNEVYQKGLKAKQFVQRYVGKWVCLKVDTKHLTGFYGRLIAVVYPTCCCNVDNKTKSINQILLEKGLAVPLK